MRLSHLFAPEAVGVRLKSKRFTGAVAEIVEVLHQSGRITDDALARRDILAREKQGSTVVGKGIAIPHASTAAVNQPLVAYAHSERGVQFGQDADERVHHVFLVLGTQTGGPLHLRILARLAGLLDSPEFCAGLVHDDPSDTMAWIQEHCGESDQIVQSEEMPSVSVFVSGAGGVALAAHAALLGCRVRVFGRTNADVEILAAMRGVNVEGEVTGFARFEWAGTDFGSACDDADLLLISAPAVELTELAGLLAPHIRDGQAVILCPGRVGGALAFHRVLRQKANAVRVYVCETQMALYECSMTSPALVTIKRIRESVPLSAIPAYALPEVLSLLNSALPYFVAGDNVLRTGLDNTATFFVPALVLLNAARIDGRSEPFKLYREGAAPSVVRVLEGLDRERIAVANALGVRVLSASEWLRLTHGANGNDLRKSLKSVKVYDEIEAPDHIDHPVLVDCIAHGLIPLVSLGEQLDVPTPIAESLVEIGCVMLGRDLKREGCTTETMGLSDLPLRELRVFVETGQEHRR